MNAAEYRALAKLCRLGWRRHDGSPCSATINAGKVGAASAMIAHAISDLESGGEHADVLRCLRRAHAELEMSPEEFVEHKERRADEYDARAAEMEAAEAVAS